MKNRHSLNFVLAATLLSLTVLTVDIPFVRAIEWSSEMQLTTHSSQDRSPSIMQAENGTIWAVWASDRKGLFNEELFYKTSSNHGLNWSLDTRLTQAAGADSGPSIMQASNGTIWVVWSSDRYGNYDLFYKTYDGSAWSTEETQLTNETHEDIGASIMQASNGTIWVVWCSNRYGNYDLFYKTYDGSAWSTETQLTDDSGSDKGPSIVQARDGTVWVVWYSYRTGNHELFYKTFNGSAWSSYPQLTDDPDSDMAPSIAQARDGAIWVVWQSDRSAGAQDELYYKIHNGSVWSSDTQLTDNPACDTVSSIAQIDDRKIWVVWQADRDYDYDIYYKKTSSEIINHDVAITNITPSASIVNPGETVYINVTVENQGDKNETFDVNCYANTTTIESTTITLDNGTSTTLTFTWNTTDINKGNYTISAEASVVFDEIYTANNVYSDGTVTVTILGDMNGDGRVDIHDLALFDEVYGTVEGDSNYNQDADLNDDEVIDIYDLMECSKNYGKMGF